MYAPFSSSPAILSTHTRRLPIPPKASFLTLQDPVPVFSGGGNGMTLHTSTAAVPSREHRGRMVERASLCLG